MRGFDRIVEKKTIAAAHHGNAVGDKAAHLVLAGIDLPILLRTLKAEQHFGDGAIALAMELRIESAQREDVELPELRGHFPKIPARRIAAEGAPEPLGGVRAQVVKAIHRQDRGVECRCIGHGLGKPELMRHATDLPDAVPAIGGAAQIEAGEMSERDNRFRIAVMMLDGQQFHGLRPDTRIPEERLFVGGCVRVAREIATPSAA